MTLDKLARKKLALKEKIQENVGLFARPIRTLRTALGMAQEACARAIGVSWATWRAWEYGTNQPRRLQLEKIADLATDAVIRANFWLDIYLAGINMSRIESMGKDVKPEEIQRLRYVNDAVRALKILHASAAGGNGTAQEMLRSLAYRLLDAAGKAENAAARHGRKGNETRPRFNQKAKSKG